MPLPGTRTIPLDWSAHHHPVAEGALNGTATVYDPDLRTPGPWDDETESPTIVEGEPLLTDAAVGIMSIQSDRVSAQAGDQVRTREYLVRFTAATSWMREGLLIKVTDGHADEDLTGRWLRVTDAQLGTERFQRDVVCVDSTETGAEVSSD